MLIVLGCTLTKRNLIHIYIYIILTTGLKLIEVGCQSFCFGTPALDFMFPPKKEKRLYVFVLRQWLNLN